MSRISIADSYVAPEVDLWGHVFVVRPMTKHLEASAGTLVDEIGEKLGKVEKGLDLVEVVGEYFDVVLKRNGAELPEGQKPSKPSSLLKKHWNMAEGNKDALSIEQLIRFFLAIQEAGQVPPT